MFVVGEAGVGKTRLLREATALAAAAGGVVLAGRAVQSGGRTPFRPIAEVVLAAGRTASAPELGPFGPILARLTTPSARRPDADGMSPLMIAEGVVRLLASHARHQPVLVALEDLHWADDDTLDVIDYLADQVGTLRVLCMGAIRAEPAPDGGPSGAVTLARELGARRTATVLELARLGRLDVEAMIEACLRVPGGTAAVGEFVHRFADGLPFLVEELLGDARRDGVLVAVEGTWRVEGELRLRVPEGFAGSVRRRLDALPGDAAGVVAAAAVLGARFDWAPLAGMTGRPEPDVLDALRVAAASQLLVVPEAPGEPFRFRHALTREAVRSSLLAPERAALAGRGLAAVVALHPDLDGGWCALAAGLADEAGDVARAAELYLRTGRRALADGALATAQHDLEHARRRAAGDLARSAEIQEALIDVLAQRGERDQAHLTGQVLLRLLDALDAPATRRAATHLRLATVAVAGEDWALATEQIERAAACGAADPAVAAQLDAVSAHVAIGEGRSASARVLAERALACADAAPETACAALEVIGRVARLSDVAESATVFRRALAVADRAGLALWRARALHELATVEWLREFDWRGLEEALAVAQEAGAVVLAANIDAQLAALHGVRLDADRGMPAAQRAAHAARRLHLDSLPIFLIRVAMHHAIRGERDRMEAVLTELVAVSEPAHRPQAQALAWGQCRALWSLLTERRDRAVAELAEGMRWTASCGTVPPAPFRALWPLIRVLERVEEVGPDQRVAPDLLAITLNRGLLDYARAAEAGRAGDGVGAQELFARAERDLSVLDPDNGQRHLGLRLLAEAALRDGWGEPAAIVAPATAFFTRRGMGPIAGACRDVARRAGIAVPRRGRGDAVVPAALAALGVTSREVDVLGLLAEGLTNRQIGERLFLSARTVGTHVAHLLRKTDLGNRAQLAALATTVGVASVPARPNSVT